MKARYGFFIVFQWSIRPQDQERFYKIVKINWNYSLKFCWVKFIQTFFVYMYTKADPGSPPPPFENMFWFVTVNFDYITRIYFNCSQHKICTICILFSIRTTKNIGYVLRGIKTNTKQIILLKNLRLHVTRSFAT